MMAVLPEISVKTSGEAIINGLDRLCYENEGFDQTDDSCNNLPCFL